MLLLAGAALLGSCAKGAAIDGASIVYLLQPTAGADAGADAAVEPDPSSSEPEAAP